VGHGVDLVQVDVFVRDQSSRPAIAIGARPGPVAVEFVGAQGEGQGDLAGVQAIGDRRQAVVAGRQRAGRARNSMASALPRVPNPSSTRSTAPCGVGRTSTWPALALKSSKATKPFTKLGRASRKAASSDSYRQWIGVGGPSSEDRDEETMIGSDMDAP
jgi:hypothetical protein